jgi:hypothetical protein
MKVKITRRKKITMDKNELKNQVRQVVDELFSAKEEAEIRKNTEAALEESANTIRDLTTALEDKDTEVAELKEKISTTESVVEELKSQLEAAKKDSEDKDPKLESALKNKDEEITKMKESHKEEIAAITCKLAELSAKIRMAELEEAGVINSDKESQEEKVKAMTDEEFASYKAELSSIREAVIKELEKSAKKEKEKDKEKDKEKEDDEEDEKKKKEKKTKASLNLEISKDDVVDRYNELGKAMASRFIKKDK